MSRAVKIVAKEGQELPEFKILAEEIAMFSKVGKQIQNSRLKLKTILIILSHATGLSQEKCKLVLDALPQLEKEYLK